MNSLRSSFCSELRNHLHGYPHNWRGKGLAKICQLDDSVRNAIVR